MGYFKKGLATFGALAILGLAVFAGGLKIGSTGTKIVSHYHATSSVDVASIAPYAATSSLIAVPGALVGDKVIVTVTSGDLLSTTSSLSLFGRVTTSSYVSTTFRNTSGTAFDAGASVIDISTWGY